MTGNGNRHYRKHRALMDEAKRGGRIAVTSCPAIMETGRVLGKKRARALLRGMPGRGYVVRITYPAGRAAAPARG